MCANLKILNIIFGKLLTPTFLFQRFLWVFCLIRFHCLFGADSQEFCLNWSLSKFKLFWSADSQELIPFLLKALSGNVFGIDPTQCSSTWYNGAILAESLIDQVLCGFLPSSVRLDFFFIWFSLFPPESIDISVGYFSFFIWWNNCILYSCFPYSYRCHISWQKYFLSLIIKKFYFMWRSQTHTK